VCGAKNPLKTLPAALKIAENFTCGAKNSQKLILPR
jgi:hypothetical protein